MTTSLPGLSHVNWMLRSLTQSKVTYEGFKAELFLTKYSGGRDSLFNILHNYPLNSEHTSYLLNGLKQMASASNVSVLLIWGKNYDTSQMEFIAKNVKLDHIYSVDNGGYLLQEDQPEAFTQEIVAFVRKLPASIDKIR